MALVGWGRFHAGPGQGIRYDLAPNIALKVDYPRYDPKDASRPDLASAAIAFTF